MAAILAAQQGFPVEQSQPSFERGRAVVEPAATMVDMSDLADTVSEAIDKADEGGGSNLNGLIALSVAVVATFAALCNVKGGNIGQAMQQAQANVVDGWAYYQAKGTKLNIAESARDMLRVQADITPGLSAEGRALLVNRIADYDGKIAAYEREKGDIRRDTEAHRRSTTGSASATISSTWRRRRCRSPSR